MNIGGINEMGRGAENPAQLLRGSDELRALLRRQGVGCWRGRREDDFRRKRYDRHELKWKTEEHVGTCIEKKTQYTDSKAGREKM